MSSAVVSMGVQTSLQGLAFRFFQYILRSGIAGFYDNSALDFLSIFY